MVAVPYHKYGPSYTVTAFSLYFSYQPVQILSDKLSCGMIDDLLNIWDMNNPDFRFYVMDNFKYTITEITERAKRLAEWSGSDTTSFHIITETELAEIEQIIPRA